jgi:hypothetical protein
MTSPDRRSPDRSALGAVFVLISVFVVHAQSPSADLLLVNGRVYTLAWDEPDREGRPAANAPYDAKGWHPDAEAIAIRGDRIAFVGSSRDAQKLRGPGTRVIDLAGATVVPGLVDSHTHVAELGARLDRVNLLGVTTEQDAVDRVVEWAKKVPKGDWIIGWGWDEGAWANRYPDMTLLSARVPDHPVALRGLHSFAVWGNRLAFERAGITRDTPSPDGGEIRRDASGRPTGLLVNSARALLDRAIPPVTPDTLKARVEAGLREMARSGYAAVHEAGVDTPLLSAFETLEREGTLPIRVFAMLAVRDKPLLGHWRARGPDRDGPLVVRTVKAFYDGALGSRGAFLLDDYSDRPGHRGVGGAAYGFDRDELAAMANAGFQLSIHAIGDRANREALDFLADQEPDRDRVEHAQVLSPADIPRFAALGVIASMQPPHAVEDKEWAEARVGAQRIKGAYAWRSLRRRGARLVFNSDLAGSDHNVFYGWHAAITRRDKQRHPDGGWYPDERMTPEEALRGYTTWAAYAAFEERDAGALAAGWRADITVIDIDPIAAGLREPGRLLAGKVTMTIAGGRLVYP